MELLFKREQTSEGVLKVKFKLWAKIELDEEEQALVDRYDYDGLFVLPQFDWNRKHTVAEYWDVRNELNRQLRLVRNFDGNRHLIKQLAGVVIEQPHQACPSLYERGQGDDGIAPTDPGNHRSSSLPPDLACYRAARVR